MTESDAVRCGGSVACPVSTGGTRRRLGSVRLTVVISALVSSFRLPRSGVEVQDAAGLPLLNLVVIVPLLPHFELSSPREPEEPPLLQLRALTPLSVPLELSFRLSSRVHYLFGFGNTSKVINTYMIYLISSCVAVYRKKIHIYRG